MLFRGTGTGSGPEVYTPNLGITGLCRVEFWFGDTQAPAPFFFIFYLT